MLRRTYETEYQGIRHCRWFILGPVPIPMHLVDHFFDGATGHTTVIGAVYRGYSVSPTGSFIGLAWGLVDGLIGGAIFAWLYNWLVGRFPSAA